MEYSQQILSEIAVFLESKLPSDLGALPDIDPIIDPEAYLRAILPGLLRQVDSSMAAPLTPLEAELYFRTDNALMAAGERIGMGAEEKKKFRLTNHLGRSRILAAFHTASPAAREIINQTLYGSRISVRPYSLDIPADTTKEQITAAIKEATGIDLDDPPQAPVLRADPLPVRMADLQDGRLAITYGACQETSVVLDSDFVPHHVVEQRMATIVLDATNGSMDVRGSPAVAADVADSFLGHLSAGQIDASKKSRCLTSAQVDELAGAMRARLLKEKARRKDADKSGISVEERTVADGFADLRDAPGYKSQSPRDPPRWHMHFEFGGESYALQVSWKTGNFWFLKGTTNDEVIRYVMNAMNAVLDKKGAKE